MQHAHDHAIADALRTYPGQIIGFRVDGRPIRTIAGGAPDGDEGGGEGQGEGQSTGTESGSESSQASNSGQSSGSESRQSGGQKSAEKVEDLPDWAQKQIRDARKEAGDRRGEKNAAEQKYQATLDGIAKALGLKGEDEKVDPAKLTEQLNAAREDRRQTSVELAVYRAAGKHEGDPDALLDSRAFLAKTADLDPTAKDFAAKVETAIKDAVKDNPKLKTARAAGASSVDHSGQTGERRSSEPRSLTDAVSGHYGT